MADRQPIELWGGLECTIARVGDDYRDQLAETGHRDRPGDLDLVAGLGIRTLRYPVLWESVAPDHPERCDFRWHDERFAQLRALGIRPIAGLVHHGSGPRYTSLVDPAFPDLFAAYAARVAERYPWVDLWTPVNEPLTTARFSGLYGHWYPHGHDEATFLRALVVECKATLLAMRAIRRVNPTAQLVQTDDLGKIFSTPTLAYQAEYENERRWLTFDLLCGRVGPGHRFWRTFLDAGVPEADLALLRDGDGAPDIFGINHYLTSDRYLDQRLDRYPEHHRGGNGRHRYADAEAVRVHLPESEIGFAARLRETWARYGRPIAITEVHHGCSRDEQLRWLVEVWNAAHTVRDEGVDMRGVTIWTLFGTMDWSSLLTQRRGHYEAGPFDVRGPAPRRTALAHAAESLAKTGAYDHPVLDRAGWWWRDERFYRPKGRAAGSGVRVAVPRRVLVTGATGTLGRAMARVCDHRGLDHVVTSRAELDIADRASVRAALERHRPWAVVNTAGYVRVADAEREPERCRRENADGAAVLAEACAGLGIPYLTFSSDLVFDGRKGAAYVESDPAAPAGVYGATKAEAERRVLEAHPGALVARTSAFFGPWDRHNFVWAVLNAVNAGRAFEAGQDVVSPTYVPDLVHGALDLLIDGGQGVWHLANRGSMSWAELARHVTVAAGFDPDLVRVTGEGPVRDTTLSSERGLLLPELEGAIDRYFREADGDWVLDDVALAAE
ncbi:family 1 glycosylhydrolase [Salinarimonas soli]|uniref:dTDP-4-dehydrorhamnose reductase n=1 Tax=Salinarimonas soli TaxID=1638099 RepID=A0A5B2VCB4_9HYPH|nr:family 1 glycosylhydrolase [Salinarimonas soli]KAA2235747.1 sugar nucleotide-binding protein [Salinarimonas soli]